LLAQVKSSNHTCQTTANRNKAELPDFYGILNGGAQWSDPDFTPDASALAWSDMGERFGTSP